MMKSDGEKKISIAITAEVEIRWNKNGFQICK